MKLEVGMYVRTKNGSIDKIIDTTEEWHCLGEDEEDKLYKIYQLRKEYYDDEFDEDNDWVFEKFIIKASHNIIDLIEVGDYVNGVEVIEIYEKGNKFKYSSMYSFREKTIEVANDNYETIPNEALFTNDEIKSIVTKEQFESMSYKVGD